jgi:hypothetical protein
VSQGCIDIDTFEAKLQVGERQLDLAAPQVTCTRLSQVCVRAARGVPVAPRSVWGSHTTAAAAGAVLARHVSPLPPPPRAPHPLRPTPCAPRAASPRARARAQWESAARTLVAEMMILVGEAVGRLGAAEGLPLPYRGQEAPTLPPDSELAALPEGPVRGFALRRCMTRSVVQASPVPHASLGLAAYVQVTSPIRRHTDLLAHFNIKVRVAQRAQGVVAGWCGALLRGSAPEVDVHLQADQCDTAAATHPHTRRRTCAARRCPSQPPTSPASRRQGVTRAACLGGQRARSRATGRPST